MTNYSYLTLKVGSWVETPLRNDETGLRVTGRVNALSRDAATVHFSNGFEQTFNRSQLLPLRQEPSA